MKDNVKFFKVLSDPNRLRILKMLQVKELCVCEITAVLNLAPSTVSQHLKLLKNAGFILEWKDGKWVNYRLNPNPRDKRITAFLSAFDFWFADDSTITEDKMKAKKADREIICCK
ncbi:MAG: metalloregulator ArsR/SmtB family transcription factor [Ignavibacteriales bacterium]|jgi:Predicted transcriptional regulators|nr:MAG: winged helix-turn-helix transcriptional regulator [Ignavibacteriaceae bacterium]MBW7873562.1 winged helix-turn-helix transcriptional regulator [Ignavibacteria bacterium]MCZ2143793.1 metalloregulator ArsR/SmtB family transcription factor [Ignavibacteriales bacterium]OQY70025.1 MAG: transcriptional regulator [Ignavibacteriales bacterium UTCHB3]MBV6445936.1 Arsenic resistance transcriptional regulator ArsR2 [Ignavibacteriaceae bacterium]